MSIRLYRIATGLAAAGAAAACLLLAARRSAEPAVLDRWSVRAFALLVTAGLLAAALACAAALPPSRVQRLLERAGFWTRHLAPRLAVMAAALAVLFLAGEGIVRIFGGLGCRPSIDTLATDVQGTPYRLNRHGYRDDDHDTAKPPGVFRLLVLGDSVAFGQGVPEAETWTRRLPDALGRRGAARVELINAGRIGWDTVRELGELEAYGLAFSPDIVLISFVLNDADWWDPGYYELRRPVPRFMEPAVNWSCLYRFVKRRYNGLLVQWKLAPSYVEHQRRVLHEDAAGWRRCREALDRIIERSRERGARVCCIVWPMFAGEQPYPLREAHDLVLRTLAERQVDALDLEPVFAPHPPDRLKVLGEEDPHPSAAAYAIATEAIAEFLMERGAFPRASR